MAMLIKGWDWYRNFIRFFVFISQWTKENFLQFNWRFKFKFRQNVYSERLIFINPANSFLVIKTQSVRLNKDVHLPIEIYWAKLHVGTPSILFNKSTIGPFSGGAAYLWFLSLFWQKRFWLSDWCCDTYAISGRYGNNKYNLFWHCC